MTEDNRRQKTIWNFVMYLYIVLVVIFILKLADASLCPSNQTAELGEPGHIHCNLPEDFSEVYWYDNTSESSSHVILYKPNEGVKSGPGFERGEYDVQQDGSLIITNVTASHERMYRVIVISHSSVILNTLITLKVTASPNHLSPSIGCQNCYDGYYYSLVEGETLSCSFGAARPPVKLEWFYKSGDGYDHVEMQSLSITENGNGTYNSLATLQSLSYDDNLIHLHVCRATQPNSIWRKEKEVLVDISGKNSFSNITPKTQYMEVNRYASIPCGGSSSVFMIWKRITSSGNPELVGFHSHIMTRTVISALDIEVSADGSLVFSSPRVHHEGIYACISGDWLNEEINVTSVEILILPSPPYMQIKGCDDISQRCLLSENTTKELECAVYGVRPNATLHWTAEDANQISFFNQNLSLIPREEGETSDAILRVEYNVSKDVVCGNEIVIHCNLHGPLSKKIKPSAAFIRPAPCNENADGVVSAVVLSVIFAATLVGVIVGNVLWCLAKPRIRHTQNKGHTAAPRGRSLIPKVIIHKAFQVTARGRRPTRNGGNRNPPTHRNGSDDDADESTAL